MQLRSSRSLVLLVAGLALVHAGGLALAQDEAGEAPEPKGSSLFRDPDDGAFDVSNWVATRKGVLPVVSPITEPAVGYGATVVLIWIHSGSLAAMRNAPLGVSGKPVPPDISAIGGAWTTNGTWAGLLGHVGFWKEDRWRYMGAGGYISPRLDVYDAKGQGYRFNLEGWSLVQELRRRVGRTNLFLGARYLYFDATTRFDVERLPPDIPEFEFKRRESGLGAVLEYDTRDNIFTPNRGIQVRGSAMFFDPEIGSDREYQRYSVDSDFYWDMHPRFVLSTRLRGQAVRGDEPFYARPFVTLRGIPVMRYQGENAISLDTEARWGLTKRWWLVGFAGEGWTDAGSIRSLEDTSVFAGGAGFRYLVARLLGLQMGIDVAKGPEQWAGYIVFGSSW